MEALLYIAISWRGVDAWLGEYLSLNALTAMAALMVAILIPVAIFMIDNKNESGFAWDKAVILSKILKAPNILIAALLLTLPLVFWNIDLPLKPLILGVFVTGVFILITSLVRAYIWLKVTENKPLETYRTKKRLEYLKTLKHSDKEAIWSMTWSDNQGRALIDDKRLVPYFIQHLSELQRDGRDGATLLREFMGYIDKIHLADPDVFQDLICFSMEWASNLAKENKNDQVNPVRFRTTTRYLFFDLAKRAFNDEVLSYLFFETVDDYIESDSAASELRFVRHFATNFFDILENSEDWTIVWESFPDKWKITIDKIRKDENEVISQWLKAYLKWITTRNLYIGESNTYDVFAESVTENLLPNVEPLLWSDLIVLHWSPYGVKENEDSDKAQIRNFIERKKSFGIVGRSYGFWEADSADSRFIEEYKNQKQEVLNFVKYTDIFPRFKNTEILDKYIEKASSLSYPSGSNEENAKENIIATLTMVREWIDSETTSEE